MARLGGRKIKLPRTGAKLDRVFTYTLESMAQACELYRQSWIHRQRADKAQFLAAVPPQMLGGDPATLPDILARAEVLTQAAIDLDARLGSRPGWVRAVEGIELDPALFLAGEEACCWDRRRKRQVDHVATGEPVRVVISTDTRHVTPAAASAFVAAAQLASQFVPLEIWWQGSWLMEEGPDRGNGHVFHVPLVSVGSLDFSRLQFVLCSELRDHASFAIMFAHAFPAGLSWGAGLLDYSSLPGTHDFIPASGLQATAESVAARAAKWAGMEPLWFAECEANRSTLQEWSAPACAQDASTASAWEPSEEDRARWAKQDAEAETMRVAAAKTRAGELF